jgi:colanic acid/amylovoran biosynthesis glycosyltransferase
MKLAVFTSQYPARVATFFERDMRSLLEAGVAVDIFAIYPLNNDLWRYSLELLDQRVLPRTSIHHVSLGKSLRRGAPLVARRPITAVGDASRVLFSALRHGPRALAKSAYVLPKAWAWAADAGEQYDHVLAYWGNFAGTCAYAFHRLLRRPVPFSIWLHAGTDLYRSPVFMREKLLYADNIVTCCEFNVGYIRQQFAGISTTIAPRVHVCHHGLDLAEFPYQPDGRSDDRVIAVGRLAAHKGFDDLLRAAALLRGRGVPMTVELVGDGPEQSALRALAAELGVSEHVAFRGWLPFPEARQAMSRATLLTHPSDGLGDGLPNVIREAMALGTPVIGTNVAGIPDALGDGCGRLVPPRDPAALAQAIGDLLEAPEARRIIAERARRRVEERYDLWRNGATLAERLRSTRRPNRDALREEPVFLNVT